MALSEAQKANFQTLSTAFEDGAVALMECVEVETGNSVAVICTVFQNEEGEYEFTPFARLFKTNPYEEWVPPITEEQEVE